LQNKGSKFVSIDTMEGQRYSSTHSLPPRYMGLRGQPHASAKKKPRLLIK